MRRVSPISEARMTSQFQAADDPEAQRVYAHRWEWQALLLASSKKPRAKNLGIVIANLINGKRGARGWASQEALAKMCGCTDRTIRTALGELEAAPGFVRIEESGGGLRRVGAKLVG